MEKVDSVVIGAGVVGLACARALAARGHEVLILDAAARFGSGISSRNSEVVHAGLYYPPGSLKAALCVRGRELLEAFCARTGVARQPCGKIVVAASAAQVDGLEAIMANAAACGVHDLEWLDGVRLKALEPALAGACGLLSPSTAIIDSHALMLALLGDAQRDGAWLATHAPVQRGAARSDGLLLEVGGAAPLRLLARQVVNAAGLEAPLLARRFAGLDESRVPRQHYARGNYFVLQGRSPFSRLIYPLPEAGGLGIHLTLDLAGQARFGPDVEWIERPDYAVDPQRAATFEAAIRSYWPQLPAGALRPGYAGVRPKLHGPGEPAADFRIDDAAVHGVRGLVNLFGIESPGLTASLAIAERVVALLDH